tara:strand:- start:1754 stop:4567 length:2814 start_codon:yes stop_codon:yes gene_type:complete
MDPLNQKWQEAIKHVLKTNEDWDTKNNSEKYNVSFDSVVMPAKIVLSRAYDYMEENYPELELPKSIGGGIPTNQFIEKYGFKISEDLVYNNTERENFKIYYITKVKNKELFQNFISYGSQILEELEIDTYKVRMAIEKSGDISIVVGMRTSYSYNEKNGKTQIGFLVSKAFKKATELKNRYVYNYKYKGEPEQDFVKIEIENWDAIPSDLVEEHKKQFKLQYDFVKGSKFTQWNVEANTTNSAIKYLMFEDGDVEELLKNNNKKHSGRRYWALGFNSNHKRLKNFIEEGYWQAIDYDKDDKSGAANRTRKKFNEIQIGDFIIIKGFGGSHDLVVHYKAKVVAVDKKIERLSLEKLEGPLYKGKAPRGEGAGIWYDTVLEIKRKEDIDLLFLNNKEMENVKKEFIDWLIVNPKADYFGNDFDTLDRYLTTYNSYFDIDLFECSVENYRNIIAVIDKAAYQDESSEFYKYSQRESTHRPRAILGKRNYFNFLNEKFGGLSSKSQAEKNVNAFDFPLNQILYGPPGTGKTFELQNKYFEKFTVRESSLNRKQYLENMIADKTWWQVLSMAILDLGNATVNEIMNNELIKTKAELSNSKLPRTTIWGRLQAHTVEECKNVNVSERSEPRMFFKDDDTKWSIDKNLLEQYYPEAITNLEESKNFQPSSDKLIKNYEFVTFHQSFSYEDFVEGIKPKMEEQDTEVSYEIADGVFKKLALKAKADPENKYAIFIDEINRGNVSAIFGELITLLEEDKRMDGNNPLTVKLPYSKKEFEVPSNLYVFGTMNTADRSVEALDTALRRRFSFKEIMPDPRLLEDIEFDGFNLKDALETINERIEFLLDRDHTIGHSYFMNLKSDDTAGLEEVFKNKVIPLLQEYFYHDYEKIALILGAGFVAVKTNHEVKFPRFDGITAPDNVTLCELVTDIKDIEKAILKLLNRDGE